MRFDHLLAFSLASLAVATPTFAQAIPDAPASSPRPAASVSARTAQPPQPTTPGGASSDLIHRSGNSLMRAALATPTGVDPNADPGVQTLHQVSFFAVAPIAPRVLKKHDLITIIIRQESTLSSTGDLDNKREHTLDYNLEQFVKLSLANFALEGLKTPVNPTEAKWDLAREQKNTSQLDRADSYIDRLGAEVVDVKPNGTVVLQAQRHLHNDDEEETIVLSGSCRAEDVTADNTILSNQLHDLDMNKQTSGAVHDGIKRGWGGKLLDLLSPF